MPGSAPRADGSHVRVAIFIVNNRPETMERIRPHVKVGSSHDAAVAALSCPGRGAARAERSGALQTRDRYGPWRSQPATAPDQRCTASLALALHPIRDTQASDAFVALFTFQTAHLVPTARFCARGFQLCFTHSESTGGRSPEEPSGAAAP